MDGKVYQPVALTSLMTDCQKSFLYCRIINKSGVFFSALRESRFYAMMSKIFKW